MLTAVMAAVVVVDIGVGADLGTKAGAVLMRGFIL